MALAVQNSVITNTSTEHTAQRAHYAPFLACAHIKPSETEMVGGHCAIIQSGFGALLSRRPRTLHATGTQIFVSWFADRSDFRFLGIKDRATDRDPGPRLLEGIDQRDDVGCRRVWCVVKLEDRQALIGQDHRPPTALLVAAGDKGINCNPLFFVLLLLKA